MMIATGGKTSNGKNVELIFDAEFDAIINHDLVASSLSAHMLLRYNTQGHPVKEGSFCS
jgi:hypothetical protein